MEFVPFNKIPRLSREIIISEKIDGTNATIYINEDMSDFLIGSRTKWITPQDDNYGFARWCYEHKDELLTLGPGFHRGEWWGKKIQRGYNVLEKRFSLFNTSLTYTPPCCLQVPVLYEGPFDTSAVDDCIEYLATNGSQAAPGFMKPEGVVVFHTASQHYYKKMIEHDSKRKGELV